MAPPLDPRLDPDALVDRYGTQLWQVAMRLVGNPADADDVVQETLIKVLRKGETFRGDSDPMGWIYRIALNEAREHFRRRKRKRMASLDDLPIEFDDTSHPVGVRHIPESPTEGLEAEEVDATVRDAIDDLPDGYREAVILVDLSGLSYVAAAEAMDLGLGAFKTRLHRARLYLRQRLQAWWDARQHAEDGA